MGWMCSANKVAVKDAAKVSSLRDWKHGIAIVTRRTEQVEGGEEHELGLSPVKTE